MTVCYFNACKDCAKEKICGTNTPLDYCSYYQPHEQTNEEWFCKLNTEEKVTALLDLRERIRIKMRGEIGSENKFYNGEYYREWLKEKHGESE